MAEEICISLGFRVSPSQSRKDPWDLLINGLRVQVKKRTTNRHRPAMVELRTAARASGVAYRRGEIDALVIMLDDVWFVFHASVVANENGDLPNSLRVNSFSMFRDAWHVLDGATLSVERQLGFDF
jgi:hypothetical protein